VHHPDDVEHTELFLTWNTVPRQGIVERGVYAEGVGSILRGYYRDHGRFMNAEELGHFQNVLTCSSGELHMYLGADLVKYALSYPQTTPCLCSSSLTV